MRFACLLLLASLCVKPNAYAQKLFRLVPGAQSGISFANTLTENDTLNILNQANIYNGGGVGIGDFNNDGLPDIYFAGNMVSNKLYLNKGSLKFEDITEASGTNGNKHWCTGVSVIDINADGLQDIYVAASFSKNQVTRTNLLYINQGNNPQGIPIFKESATAYGLADTGFSTQGYFFDYDRDGDLDLYLVTNALYDPKTPIRFRPKVKDGTALNTDRLYRNNGNNTFTNVSRQAGILIEGWGHAACVSDFNNDGWPDVYVANDFVSNDILYINNRNGTFTDRIGEYFRHTAWNAMGSDYVDINNDGFPDLISLEMLPEDNMRKKRMLSGNEYYNYFNSAEYGYLHQYVRNVVQLNSGNTTLGHPLFSDVGFLSGTYQTDWSWCPLVADFDNDGYRDMIVSNGLPRDVTDLDYISYDNGQGGGKANLSLTMAHTLPVVQIPNYAFRNSNGIQFQNVTGSWGLDSASFSNGSAYADLDNDGDLDIVINNINGEAFLYENTGNNVSNLRISLNGPAKNRNGIGTRITVYVNGSIIYYEHQPARGYLSSVDGRAHFGLGTHASADSVKITWPDGRTQLIITPERNLVVKHADARVSTAVRTAEAPLFTAANKKYNIHHKPVERDFIDYTIQPTLPHKLSQYGPGIAVGDIDNNGFEDFYIGGSSGNPGLFFMQDATGRFSRDSTRIPRSPNELEEEMGVLLFDADNDGDLDLYTVSGSYEIPPNNKASQDRLFINNGRGRFTKAANALPAEASNGSCVKAADFDNDGDADLFIGGRVVSGAYPVDPQSILLRNTNGKFTDVTLEVCPELRQLGMITDALWTDFDNDGLTDLIVVGEWMPISFFRNNGKRLTLVENPGEIGNHFGWWNSITGGDFDNDGDIDYVAGNLGTNSSYQATASEPMTILAKDIDNNGSLDAMVFCYMKGEANTRRAYPMHTRDDLSSQLVSIRKKYPTYAAYGLATIDNLWSAKDKEGAIIKQANDMQTSYIENKGNGQFSISPLPLQAQTAPVFGMRAEDVDADGNLDLILVGNDYGMEPYSGRHDAFNGLCLLGDGKGGFVARTATGLLVKGDAKGLATLHSASGEDILIATQNQDSLVATSISGAARSIAVRPDDRSAELQLSNGTRRVEFYYGSSFLSQSTRRLRMDRSIKRIVITNARGEKRIVQ